MPIVGWCDYVKLDKQVQIPCSWNFTFPFKYGINASCILSFWVDHCLLFKIPMEVIVQRNKKP